MNIGFLHRNSFILTLIIIIIGFFIFSSKFKKIKILFEQKQTESLTNYNTLKKDNLKIFNDWETELRSNNVLLKENILLENENYENVKFNDITNGRILLIFRITDNVSSCYDCKIKVFNKLKELGKRIGNENIIVIGRYNKMKDLIILKEAIPFDFQVFNYSYDLNLYIENKKKYDYIFLIDNNKESRFVFVATKIIEDKIDVYFSHITNYFKNVNNLKDCDID